MPAMQLLLYPATDAVGGRRSRELFADGFLLTRADLDVREGHYLPPRPCERAWDSHASCRPIHSKRAVKGECSRCSAKLRVTGLAGNEIR